MSRRNPPKIVKTARTAASRFFQVEELHLEFSNGESRIYERLVGSGRGAVMVVPVTAEQELLLVREYAAGSERYELGFPKGLVDPGEQAAEAANRELQEEIGFKAAQLSQLTQLSVAPGYFSSSMSIFVATQLSPSELPGDEPEPLELVRVPISQCEDLLTWPDFTEARSVAALLLFQRWWQQQQG